jgi:hypothetical protein
MLAEFFAVQPRKTNTRLKKTQNEGKILMDADLLRKVLAKIMPSLGPVPADSFYGYFLLMIKPGIKLAIFYIRSLT